MCENERPRSWLGLVEPSIELSLQLPQSQSCVRSALGGKRSATLGSYNGCVGTRPSAEPENNYAKFTPAPPKPLIWLVDGFQSVFRLRVQESERSRRLNRGLKNDLLHFSTDMLSLVSGIFGAVANMSVLVWAYFHMASYSIWVTTTLVSIVFIVLGIALSFRMRRRAGSFTLGVFLGGFFFLLPFAATTYGYAFVAMPAIIVIAILSHLSVRFGYKLKRN
jgi:hypothetical protein